MTESPPEPALEEAATEVLTEAIAEAEPEPPPRKRRFNWHPGWFALALALALAGAVWWLESGLWQALLDLDPDQAPLSPGEEPDAPFAKDNAAFVWAGRLLQILVLVLVSMPLIATGQFLLGRWKRAAVTLMMFALACLAAFLAVMTSGDVLR